jgi:membrane associated rhomboid family serine protease
MLWVHTGTLWRESRAAAAFERAQEGEVVGTDAKGRPIVATMENLVKNRTEAKKWERFMREWGLVPNEVLHGDVHGVMSHMFLHADWVQLVGNMLAFWAFVGTLEATLGAWKTLLFYLFWGVAAGLVQVLGNWGSNVPYVGASGAIAGVMGAYFLCFGLRAHIRVMMWVFFGVPTKVLQVPAGAIALVWAGSQVSGWYFTRKTGIDAVALFAYLGGAGAGMLTMLLFKNDVFAKLQRTREGKWEVRAPDDLPTSSAHYPVVGIARDTAGAQISSTAVLPGQSAPQARPRCARCWTVLADENRVSGDLFRCPNCKMLTDIAPPPPPPQSSSRNRIIGTPSNGSA